MVYSFSRAAKVAKLRLPRRRRYPHSDVSTVQIDASEGLEVAGEYRDEFNPGDSQEGGEDIARILEQTSVNGAVAGGSDDWEGGPLPTDFLNADTPQAKENWSKTPK